MAFKVAVREKHSGKFLIFGEEGSGKSTFGLTFPKVGALDSEAGLTDYVGKDITVGDKKYNNVVFVDPTSSLEDLEDDLDSLLDGEYDDKIKTFIVDSETKLYQTMQISCLDVEEKRAKTKTGNTDDVGLSVRSWGKIKNLNMRFQQAKIELSTKNVHVVSVAQGANITDENGKVIGLKPDMYKNVQFDYDIIILASKETKKTKDGVEITYWGEIKKDRTNVTKVGDKIQNPTYDIWESYYESGMDGLQQGSSTYKNDMVKSTSYLEAETDKITELSEQFKTIMQEVGKDATKIKAISAKAKELGINLRALDLEPQEKLAEFVTFSQKLID
jgi:hypothetical protein